MKLYPEDCKRELWATLEAFASFGLLASFIYVLSGFSTRLMPVWKIQVIIFELIVLLAFSFGFALSACRYGRDFGRLFGVLMLFVLAYVFLGILQTFERGRI